VQSLEARPTNGHEDHLSNGHRDAQDELEQELIGLRSELELEKQRSTQQSLGAERSRRTAADERCMVLQALRDFVTGEGQLSEAKAEEALRQLLGESLRLEKDVDLQNAERLLKKQEHCHREELRDLVALCNQELRRRDRSASELL
ncbi:unnamed protein product, partial [Polarella glacialis]